MAGAEINISELRDKKRRQRVYIFAGAIALLFYLAALGAAWLLLRSPVFRAREIDISGNRDVASGAIMDLLYSRVIGGKFSRALLGFNNMLIWPQELSGKDLAFLPELKSLSIKKNFGDRKIYVAVTERRPYGIWCLMARNNVEQTQNGADFTQANTDTPRGSASVYGSAAVMGDCWWFDESGIIFKRAVPARGSLIISVDDYSQKDLGLGSLVLPEKFIGNLMSVFNVLGASSVSIKEIRLNDLSLEELEVNTNPSASFGTSNGPTLYFSLRFSAANDLAVLQSFMAKPDFGKWQYFDFRVENRAYYK